MGNTNTNCVVSGANPHSMGVVIINRSPQTLVPSGHCNCGQNHQGIRIEAGKFRPNHVPRTLHPGESVALWMSGHSWSTICPKGSIMFDIKRDETTKGDAKLDNANPGDMESDLTISFNSRGWAELKNDADLEVKCTVADLSAVVVSKNVTQFFGPEFKGTDEHRQFEVVITYNAPKMSSLLEEKPIQESDGSDRSKSIAPSKLSNHSKTSTLSKSPSHVPSNAPYNLPSVFPSLPVSRPFSAIVLTNQRSLSLPKGCKELLSGVPIILTAKSELFTCFLYTDILVESPLFEAMLKSMSNIPAFQGEDRTIWIDRHDFKWGSAVASKIRGLLTENVDYDKLQLLE